MRDNPSNTQGPTTSVRCLVGVQSGANQNILSMIKENLWHLVTFTKKKEVQSLISLDPRNSIFYTSICYNPYTGWQKPGAGKDFTAHPDCGVNSPILWSGLWVRLCDIKRTDIGESCHVMFLASPTRESQRRALEFYRKVIPPSDMLLGPSKDRVQLMRQQMITWLQLPILRRFLLNPTLSLRVGRPKDNPSQVAAVCLGSKQSSTSEHKSAPWADNPDLPSSPQLY